MEIKRERLVLEVLFTLFLFLWLISEVARLLLLLFFPSLRGEAFFLIPILFFDIFFYVEWLLRTQIALSERKFIHYHLREGGILDMLVFLFPLVLHSIPMLMAWVSSRAVFLDPVWTVLVVLAMAIRPLRLFKLLRLGGNAKYMLPVFLSLMFLAEAGNFLTIKALIHITEGAETNAEPLVQSFLLSTPQEADQVIARYVAGSKSVEVQGGIQGRIIPSYLHTTKATETGIIYFDTVYSSVYSLFSYLHRSLYLVVLFVLTLHFMFRPSPQMRKDVT